MDTASSPPTTEIPMIQCFLKNETKEIDDNPILT